MHEGFSSSIQGFNFCFINNIKDLYTDKVYKKSCPVLYTYNNKMKNLTLMHLPKISGVSQDIDFGLATIILNNNNDNIRFYL